MQSLDYELGIEIFKLIKTPISLSLTNSKWYAISQDPHSRAEWLIYKYGKAHAFFHAVRLGNSFITLEVMQALLARNAIISRYFLQRLLMHFGTHDELLKRERNIHNQVDFSGIRITQPTPWASNLPLTVFTSLLTEGYEVLNDRELATKGNDMELFHFLSAGPLVINYAPQILQRNLEEIKDLILNKRFIPFPPRPKPIYEDTEEYEQLMQARSHEDYPSKDGYENIQQLNDISKAIIIQPDLVNSWKEIGYHEICSDLNEPVIQGALSRLFPRDPPDDWECPDVDTVVQRLKQFIDLGFRLDDDVMEEIFNLFEYRLNEFGDILIESFGDILIESFQIIHKETKSSIAQSCLIKAIRPERNHSEFDLLEFLISKIDRPQEALDSALKYHNVGFKLDTNLIKVSNMRSLLVHSNIYYWILKKYGPNSEITQKCFEDIIESRIWIDLQLKENPELDVPEHLTPTAFNSICSIYLEYCNEKVPFKGNYLPYLRLANNEEIIKPFFEVSLPVIFGLQPKHKLPFDINYDNDRPDVENTLSSQNNKRKFNEMNLSNDQLNKDERNEWTKLLEEMYYGPIHANNSDITEIFKKKLEEIWEKISPSQVQVIAEQSTKSTSNTSEKRPKLH